MAEFGRTTKRLSEWMVCAKCKTPLDAALGSLRGADSSPKVTLIVLDGEPVFVHASCLAGREDSGAIVIETQMGVPQLYGFDTNQFQTKMLETAIKDPRTLVTVCTQHNYLVSLVSPSKGGHTSAAAVLDAAKRSAAYYNLLCSWLTVYRVRNLGPGHMVWRSGMYPIETNAFRGGGDAADEVLFVQLSHFHSQEKSPAPPIPPSLDMDVVYERCSLSVSDDGLDVCVNATRIPVADTHVFFARSMTGATENYVFIKRAGTGIKDVVMPAVVVTFERPLSEGAIGYMASQLFYVRARNHVPVR
mgnify:CR=1 FL=1